MEIPRSPYVQAAFQPVQYAQPVTSPQQGNMRLLAQALQASMKAPHAGSDHDNILMQLFQRKMGGGMSGA
jgi:hypothetical protein